MLIFTAIVIRSCDRVDMIELILVSSHLRSVVWNFVGLALIIA